jgi:hypothetical protein
MEKVMNYAMGFLSGFAALLTAVIPVAILWYLVTGDATIDVIGNFAELLIMVGNSGFVGLVTMLFIMSFFIKK